MRFANFICETNAACTVNASLCIQDDAGTETHSFRPVYLFNFKTAAFRPIFVGLNLEWTLACLITDRAVQRVVDQQKFQRVFLGTSHLFVGLLRVITIPSTICRLQEVCSFGNHRMVRFPSSSSSCSPVSLSFTY